MNNMLTIKVFVAAALIGTAANSVGAEEAPPGGPVAPAAQTIAPASGYVPGWYPPPPNQGRYAQPWQQPTQWPAPPPGYRQLRPYYPPYGQYRAVPAAPAENPLSVKLKQAQEQLAEKSTELNTANELLATLQAELQATREALQQSQSETSVASQQLETAIEQADSLQNVLTELKSRLETQNSMLQRDAQSPVPENDTPEQ